MAVEADRFVRCLLVGLLALAGAGAGSAASVDQEPAGVRVARLPAVEGSGLRFLGADSKGRVYALSTGDLRVVEVTTDEVEEFGMLEERAGYSRRPTVVAAAMGEAGDEWLVRAGAFDVRWFRGGREERLPTPDWMVEDVLVAGGDPVLAVQPLRRRAGTREGFGRPLLLGRAGDRWTPLAEVEAEAADPRLVSSDAEERNEAMRELRWRHTVELAAEDDGHVWVADEYAYRLREFSPGGRLRTELVLDDAALEIVERSEEEFEEVAGAIVDQGREVPSWLGRRPRAAILGMAVADGRVYLLVHADGAIALDRWDPMNLYLERVGLDGEVPVEKLSVAAGADGLFFLTVGGAADEAWWIDWASLEGAVWRPVEGAAVNGQPVVGRQPASVRIVRTDDGVRAEGRRGSREWSYEVLGEAPERSFFDRMVERGMLDQSQVEALTTLGRERVTLEITDGTAGELVASLNELFFAGSPRLAAVDVRQRVDLLVTEAELPEVVGALQAIGVVRVER